MAQQDNPFDQGAALAKDRGDKQRRNARLTGMKYPIARFESLKEALKQLEPSIRDGEHLQTGKPFARFGGLRSREIFANYLLCVALNFTNQEDRLTFAGSSDPIGGDGIICDAVTVTTWPTEHVFIRRIPGGEAENVEALILKAIGKKQSKGGAAYASGKILVVFPRRDGGKVVSQ
jgi:hypothetical protein